MSVTPESPMGPRLARDERGSSSPPVRSQARGQQDWRAADSGRVCSVTLCTDAACGMMQATGAPPVALARRPTCGTSGAERTSRSPLPSGGDIVFLAIVYLLLGLLPNYVFRDASIGWHLIDGRYILDHWHVAHHDLFSYTFPNRSWVSSEWLFDAVAAALVGLGGLPLLGVAAACSIALLFLLLFQDARRTGCPFLLALGLTLVGALASSVHWLARAHLVTFFGVYIFAKVLETFHNSKVRGAATNVILGLTMLVWSNAHAGFLVGFGMVTLYLASEAFTAGALAGPLRTAAWQRAKSLLIGLVIIVAASFVNPYGPSLYSSFTASLRQLGGAIQTQEFLSPTFHGELYSTCLGVLFTALVVGLATSRRKLWLGRLLLVVAFAALALNGIRNVPLFVIVALPVIADLLGGWAPLTLLADVGGPYASWIEALTRRWGRRQLGFDEMERRCTMHLLPAAAVVVLAGSCILGGRVPGIHPFVSSGFGAQTVPTTTLSYIHSHGLAWNRGFNMDNWGGYIRYETGQRVFVDDRTDFYPKDFMQRYGEILYAAPGWRALLDQDRIEWVLIPKTVSLAAALRLAPGWTLQAEDPAAYLFVRNR
jgi:hypothetical protein